MVLDPLIERARLFGNPERAGGDLRPDGQQVAFIAPRDGVLNVFVASWDDPLAARPITNDRLRGIRQFAFAHDNRHLLYLQDVGGDENFRLFSVNLDSGEERALTPEGSRATIVSLSRDLPDEVAVAVNDRDPTMFDLLRVRLSTGEVVRALANDKGYVSFTLDRAFNLRYAQRQTADGGTGVDRFDAAGNAVVFLTVPQDDAMTTAVVGLTADSSVLYLLDSRGRDKAGLFAVDPATGEGVLVHEDAHADVADILTSPDTGLVQAVGCNYLRLEWTVLSPEIAEAFAKMRREVDESAELLVTARSNDDRRWVVTVLRSDRSTKTVLFDRESGAWRPWFDVRPALADAPLAPMQVLEIQTRDGLVLPSYLTLPRFSDPAKTGRPTIPLPMVLLVHGGPWARDSYGLHPQHQWLANRGYAVLSVNFRGSTGFGKAFLNAANFEWGRKMHDDLLDAVAWAVAKGIADPSRVAIMGGSYGGYAALVGLTFTPKTFACGVSIVGPSSLVTLLSTIPPYWEPLKRIFSTRVGDDATEEGLALLRERSPLHKVDEIARPLLIGQGANDPRVKQAESDQIVAAMQEKGIPVTYVRFPDEGHGFQRPENSLAFWAVAEAFLGRVLGGRVQPVGADFAGASIEVPEGASLLEGLPEALASR